MLSPHAKKLLTVRGQQAAGAGRQQAVVVVPAAVGALGVDADGKYGPNSKEAAGGLSAEEAYNKYVLGNTGNNTPYITDLEDIQNWSDGILNAETEGEALRYVERLEKIDPDLADSLYEQWLKDHGLFVGDKVDTTVNSPAKGSVGGGGGGGRRDQISTHYILE